MTEFDEVIKFNEETESLEKFEHNGKVESVKKNMIKLVGKKADDVSLEKNARQKAMDHIRDLEEFSITGGEHSRSSNRQLAQNRVFHKIENVSFQMFQETICKITELSTIHLEDSLTTAEIQLSIVDLESAAKNYQNVHFFLQKIESCNNQREQRMREIVEEEENTVLDEESASTSKSSKMERRTQSKKRLARTKGQWRKRETEDGEPPRKYGKMGDEEKNSRETHSSGRKAEKVMIEVRKEAMEPIFVEETYRIRLLSGVEKLLRYMPGPYRIGPLEKWEDELEKFANELGGKRKINEDLKNSTARLLENAVKKREPAENQMKEIVEEWSTNQNQYQGINDVLEKIIKIFQDTRFTEPLFDHIGKSSIYNIMKEMSFWPIFVESKKHYTDGGYNQGSDVGLISQLYEEATCPQALQMIRDFFENVESLRIELFNNFINLINHFKNVHISHYKDFSIDVLKKLDCTHEIWSTATMSIDDETRKAEKARIECKICVVLHTLAHLRFAVGSGDFFGKVKDDPEKSIELFLKRVLKFAKIKTKVDGSKEMRQISNQLDRIRLTTVQIQSSVDLIKGYTAQIIKISMAGKLDLKTLRSRAGNRDLRDQQHYLQFCKRRMKANDKLLKDALSSLTYMINMYEKELEEKKQENNGDQQKEENVENQCVICSIEFSSVIFANFSCAHRMCAKCYQDRWKSREQCPLCNGNIDHKKVKFAVKNSEVPETKLTVKMKRTIELMKKIIGENADNKIVLFTSAVYRKPTWNCLVRALQKTEMPFAEVRPDVKNRQASTWKFTAECKILLCSPTTCSDKFNAPRTTHFIFLDQSSLFLKVGKAMYEKAKQQRLKIHHILVEGAIDEHLRQIARDVRNNPGKARRGLNFTVGEVRQMFEIAR